jgi:capsular polysaccharide biosynthesis protein
VVSRTAILFALGFGLLGALGGLFAALLTPTSYQAEAFVVVYQMPTGFTNLISPDEANVITAYYAAGALQDSVIQRVRFKYPQLTAQDIRQSVQVSIVAYTPLSRVTATGASEQVAITLANAVANAWVGDAGLVITQAYDSAYTTLIDHETALNKQIAATRAQLVPLNPASAKAKALNAQLQALESAYTTTDANIAQLERERYAVAGNAYVATPASATSVTRSPDYLKALAAGGAVGLALGIVAMLWVIRISLRSTAAAGYPAPPALAASSSMPLGAGPRSRPTGAPDPAGLPRRTAPPEMGSRGAPSGPHRTSAGPEWTSYDN